MSTFYRIKITRVDVVPDTTQKWALLNNISGEYGYIGAPDGGTTKIEREVLAQEVEAIDLAAVIKAVNGL